jgi:transposase, IS5 family
MLIDRYAPEDIFARILKSLPRSIPCSNDWLVCWMRNPLFQQVKADLARRHRLTLVHGRHTTPVEVIL